MNAATPNHELRPLSPRQLELLMRPLEQWRISQRATPGSSKKMSYLEGWDVKAMLTRVFGFGGYSSDLVHGQILRLEEIDVPETTWNEAKRKKEPVIVNGVPKTKKQWRAVATATLQLRIHQLGATYTEMAVSSQNGVDPGEVSDFAIKTAETDALKRAAINLGTAFGLSLYQDGSLNDVIGELFEDVQRAALDQGRREAAAAWHAAQGGGVQQALPAGAPQGAPQQAQQPGVPAGVVAPGSEAHSAGLAQMQAGINHS